MIKESEEIITTPSEVPSAELLNSEIESEAISEPMEAVPNSESGIDYAELLKSDMNELTEELSASETLKITDLKNPIRYGALRDLGLTPKEAYLASGGRKERFDNRAHLSSSVPRKMAASFSEIPRAELDTARELFSDMNDSEIRNLYKKVTQ